MVEVVVVVVIREMVANQICKKTAEETRRIHGIRTPGGAKETKAKKDRLSKT